MKLSAQPKKMKNALGKVSKGHVLKKREKDSFGKKKAAVLDMACESLTTPEKKKVAKSLKQKKQSSVNTVPTNSFQKATKPTIVRTGGDTKSPLEKKKVQKVKVKPISSELDDVNNESIKVTKVNSASTKSNSNLHKGVGKEKNIRKKNEKGSQDHNDSDRTLNEELLEGVCGSVLKLLKTSRESEEKKDLFDSLPEEILLQISVFKIPDTPNRIIRCPVPNSVYTSEPDVCLILPDIVRGRMRDVTFAKFAEQYDDKLKEAGVKGIKQIFSFAQLRAEYSQFELKRRLCRSFDLFLCEGRIQDHCTHFLGSSLKKANKLLMPVRALVKTGKDFEFYSNLQSKIDNAVHKVGFNIHSHGPDYCIHIGHSHLDEKQLAENIQAVWKALKEELPGGIKNIQSARLKGRKSMSIPVYVSLVPYEEVPAVKQLTKCATVEDELSTVPGFRAIVHPDGSVKLINQQTEEDAQFMKDGSINCSKRARVTMSNVAVKRLKSEPDFSDANDKDDEDEDVKNVNAAELEYLSQWTENNSSEDEDEDVPETKPRIVKSKQGAKQSKGSSPKQKKKGAKKQMKGISQKLNKVAPKKIKK